MLYRIDASSDTLTPYRSSWSPRELAVERYVVSLESPDGLSLNESVFGEPLLVVRKQARTRTRKRADILALDQRGNGVVVELKRDAGSLGVETQALQYLADFSQARGRDFIRRFSRRAAEFEDRLGGFLGEDVPTESLNTHSRIILIARSFDPSLFSMGEWLADRGVPFRCIEYEPVEIRGTRFLSFSWRFDRSSEAVFPLSFSSTVRLPGHFWHNIGHADDGWWSYLRESGQISASFECRPGDQGERILKGYVAGDTVVAYCTGHGAVGFGRVGDPPSYRLLSRGDEGDRLGGRHLHRLKVRWRATAATLSDAIPAEELRNSFGLHHPISTSVSMASGKAEAVTRRMSELWAGGGGL